MSRDAKFYFANLGVDIARCVSAVEAADEERYRESLQRAYHTLEYLHRARSIAAYEEGMLLLRALEYARADNRLQQFREVLVELIAQHSPITL